MQRDADDMMEFVRNTPTEFKEYYIQMQAAKRSQAPPPSQVTEGLLKELHSTAHEYGLLQICS